MQQRYCDPIAGRFLSVDPVTTDANTGKSFGRYHYAENNPYRYNDPDGRASAAFGEGCTSADISCEEIGGQSGGSSTRASSAAAQLQANAPALPTPWGVGGTLPVIGMDGIAAALSRILVPVGLAFTPSSLGDSSIFPIFRAVSPAELADIEARGGQFVMKSGQMEVKEFATSLVDAKYYRDQVIGKLEDSSKYSIVQTAVSGETWRQLYKMPLDQRPAVVVTRETLPSVNSDAAKFGIRVVPR